MWPSTKWFTVRYCIKPFLELTLQRKVLLTVALQNTYMNIYSMRPTERHIGVLKTLKDNNVLVFVKIVMFSLKIFMGSCHISLWYDLSKANSSIILSVTIHAWANPCLSCTQRYNEPSHLTFLALWNGSHLILFQRVKRRCDMLFYSVTLGCSDPAHCVRCEESPCDYEGLVKLSHSRWVMESRWTRLQTLEMTCVVAIVFYSCVSVCSDKERNILLIHLHSDLEVAALCKML